MLCMPRLFEDYWPRRPREDGVLFARTATSDGQLLVDAEGGERATVCRVPSGELKTDETHTHAHAKNHSNMVNPVVNL